MTHELWEMKKKSRVISNDSSTDFYKHSYVELHFIIVTKFSKSNLTNVPVWFSNDLTLRFFTQHDFRIRRNYGTDFLSRYFLFRYLNQSSGIWTRIIFFEKKKFVHPKCVSIFHEIWRIIGFFSGNYFGKFFGIDIPTSV